MDNRPLNKKLRPFSWSFSALNNFENCPLAYAGKSYYYTIPFVESWQQVWGKEVHNCADQAIKVGKDNVNDPTILVQLSPYLDLFLLKRIEGSLLESEVEIVLNEDMQQLTGKSAWFSKEAWFRAKLDVLITDNNKVFYGDWKTGAKVKDETEQLKLGCAALSVARPKLETFTGKLLFTRHKTITGGCNLDKAGVQQVWADTLPRVKRMEDAWRSEIFPARPSGLCPWCQVENCSSRRGVRRP